MGIPACIPGIQGRLALEGGPGQIKKWIFEIAKSTVYEKHRFQTFNDERVKIHSSKAKST